MARIDAALDEDQAKLISVIAITGAPPLSGPAIMVTKSTGTEFRSLLAMTITSKPGDGYVV